MTIDTDTDATPSTLPRRQLGRLLREHREGIGLSIAKAAALVELSPAALQRLEAGKTQKVRAVDMNALCDLYEASSEETARAIDLAKQCRTTSWYTAFSGLYSDETFKMYVGLEASARKLIVYNEIVPGLVQTPDYARAMISGFYRNNSPEEIERRTTLRMKRQAIVTRKRAPVELEILLHESALHRVVGGRQVMAAQLRELAEVSKRTNVSLRIHPFIAGCVNGIVHSSFSIMDFGRDARGKVAEPTLVYLEGPVMPDIYLEHADDVGRYHEFASGLRSTALDETQSRNLLRQVARSYTT